MDPILPCPVRVAVAVRPRLLADSLATLLADAGVAVVPASDPAVDLAVTTEQRLAVDAALVVELSTGPDGTAEATVRTPSGGPLVRLTGLPAIIAFVRDWTA